MAAAGSSSLRQRRTTISSETAVSLTHVPLANGSINVMMETTPIPSRRKTDVVEVVTPPDPVLSSSAQLVVAKDEGRTRKILVRATSGALMVCYGLFFVRYTSAFHLGESFVLTHALSY